MSAILLRAEVIEARIALIACPRGTAGRLHSLRLRRRFQQPQRHHSIALGDLEFTTSSHVPSEELTPANEKSIYREQYVKSTDISPQPSLQDTVGEAHASTSKAQAYKNLAPQLHQKTPHMIRARHGDGHGLYFNKSHHDKLMEGQTDRLYDDLKTGDPHAIFRGVLSHIRVTPDGFEASTVLRNLPPSTFSEILRCLDPVHFVGRYLQLFREISPRNPTYLAIGSNQHGLYHICTSFMYRIKAIVQVRRTAGFPLSLVDYKYLLRCARAVGNPSASDSLWKSMNDDGITPDTECYNQYMGVKVWTEAENGHQRNKLRIIPYHLQARKIAEGRRTQKALPYEGHAVGDGGLKSEITRLFNQMVDSGSLGDEETFCLMMVAFGREGDTDGIRSIINKVWGIDVLALMSREESSLPPVEQYSHDSPMRPSNTLLLTIAHVYGINNDIRTALRLVDYLSRQYSIDITIDAWRELLERTYVLARAPNRSHKYQEGGVLTGELHPQAVLDLWDAMTNAPYNIRPTMDMYDKLVMILIGMQKFGQARKRIDEASNLHRKLVSKFGKTVLAFDRQKALLSISPKLKPVQYVGEDNPALNNLNEVERQKAYEYLLMHRSRQYIRRWCRVYLEKSTRSLRHDQSFQFQSLQDFIMEYELFLDYRLDYETATGHVQFWSGSRDTNRKRIKAYDEQRRRRMYFEGADMQYKKPATG
jgi:hypothetical protein